MAAFAFDLMVVLMTHWGVICNGNPSTQAHQDPFLVRWMMVDLGSTKQISKIAITNYIYPESITLEIDIWTDFRVFIDAGSLATAAAIHCVQMHHSIIAL